MGRRLAGIVFVVRVVSKDESLKPRLSLTAVRKEPVAAPSLIRWTEGWGAREARLIGLAAGRYEVHAGAAGFPKGVSKTVDLDGSGELVLEIDLR